MEKSGQTHCCPTGDEVSVLALLVGDGGEGLASERRTGFSKIDDGAMTEIGRKADPANSHATLRYSPLTLCSWFISSELWTQIGI